MFYSPSTETLLYIFYDYNYIPFFHYIHLHSFANKYLHTSLLFLFHTSLSTTYAISSPQQPPTYILTVHPLHTLPVTSPPFSHITCYITTQHYVCYFVTLAVCNTYPPSSYITCYNTTLLHTSPVTLPSITTLVLSSLHHAANTYILQYQLALSRPH